MNFYLRNLFYGGDFSSHTLNNLIEFENKVVKANLKSIDKTKLDELLGESLENFNKVECNNDLSSYYFNLEYKWNANQE